MKTNDSHEFKPILAEIEDAPQNPLGRIIFWTIMAAILFFGLWTFFGKVDVVVTARGKVIPVGEIKVLQPLTTGVVRSILVKEGDFVKKDQVLMEVDPSNIEPELESMQANLKQLDLEIMRLHAVFNNEPFMPNPAAYDQAVIQVQTNIYQSTIQRLAKQLSIKDEELKQTAEQLAATRKEQEQGKYLLNVSRERLGRLEKVKEIISRDDFDQAANDVKNYELTVKAAGHRIEELNAGMKRVRSEVEFIKEDENTRQLGELAEKEKMRTQLRAEIEKSTYLTARQQIVSPVDGYVNKLFIHTESGVVSPAEKIISIVPADSPMIIKAMVQNQDVGFIGEGMDATIKIDTFSFQKYGTIDGTVKQVSRDSIEDENLGLIYEVYVEPHKTSLMVEGKETPITTGMSLTSEINVGKRRIIEFFLYPIIKYLDEGMSVR